MARSQDTFNKREREKQRVKKQQEKQEKMKERKNGKEKKSLNDMMAYLDENGNLTSTPVDPKIKQTFRQEDIEIGVPKQEARQPNAPRTGVVAFFNDHKGFGFINDSETRERIFVHVNELTTPVKENDKVSFQVGKSPKGLIAMNVELIK